MERIRAPIPSNPSDAMQRWMDCGRDLGFEIFLFFSGKIEKLEIVGKIRGGIIQGRRFEDFFS